MHIPVGLTHGIHIYPFISRLSSLSMWKCSDISSYSCGLHKLLQKSQTAAVSVEAGRAWAEYGAPVFLCSLLLISLYMIRWSTGFILAPAQFSGNTWNQDSSNEMIFFPCDPKDFHYASDFADGRWSRGRRAGWRIKMVYDDRYTNHLLICAWQISRCLRTFWMNEESNHNKSQHAQKHDKFKHDTCLLSVKAAGCEGFFVHVWSVDLNRKLQRWRWISSRFLSFNYRYVRKDWRIKSTIILLRGVHLKGWVYIFKFSWQMECDPK